MTSRFFLSLLLFFTVTGLGWAEEAKDKEDRAAKVKKLVDELKWKEGKIPLGGDLATVTADEGLRYLNDEDTNKVLSKLWGNPPSRTMGMIFPHNAGPLEARWSIVIDGFDKEGYVKDEDADKLDPNALLMQLQDGQTEANAERRKQGYAELEIVQFAIPPHFDKESKKLYWAIDLKEIGSTQHGVNYYVRVLGRRGYLVMTGMADLDALKELDSAMPQFLTKIEFNEGNRYADFNPKTDKVATYGIAGLIAGAIGIKVAAKAGILAALFTKFGPIMLALKKLWLLIIAGIAGGFSKIKNFFTRKSKPDQNGGGQL